MNITLETDYAIRIVNALVIYGERLDAKSISEETGVTLRFSLKILRKLVASKILVSFKGAHGGYELAREPSQITLYDVVKTIEGPYTFSRCIDENYECTIAGKGASICSFKSVFEDVSRTVIKKLEAVSFVDMNEQ